MPDTKSPTWLEAAEILRAKGYHLIIQESGGGMPDDAHKMHWEASISGEGRRRGQTMEVAVMAVYNWVMRDEERRKAVEYVSKQLMR